MLKSILTVALFCSAVSGLSAPVSFPSPPAVDHLTPPPSGPVTLDPEWAPKEGVIVRFPFGFGTGLFANMVDNLQDYGVVYILVENAAVESDCYNYLTSHGVSWENIECIYAATEGSFNGEWTRDYGPWFVWEEDSTLSIVDMIYFPMQPNSDYVPEFLSGYWRMGYYGPDFRHEGGNMMTDGHGTMMMTSVVFDRNPGMTLEELNQICRDYFGQDTVYVFENFAGDRLGHIDGWAKILNDTTIMVARLDPGDPNYQLVEDHAAAMAQIPTCYGTPFNVVRVQLPDPWWYTYLNSLLFNGLCLVPIYGFDLDDDALAAYQDALGPEWNVVGLNCYWFSLLGGAIHCTTMDIPRHDWLYLVDVNLTFSPVSPPVVIPPEGGSFDFDLGVENLEPDTILFDVWIEVTLPDSTVFDPVLKKERILLEPNGILARRLTQTVPASAPEGSYIYTAYAGSYLPQVISREQSFTFEKTGISGMATGADQWLMTGWQREMGLNETETRLPRDRLTVKNYPNPFNLTTVIRFDLLEAAKVKLDVFDVSGRRVGVGLSLRGLASTRVYSPGTHEITFDGSGLPSGVYVYRLTAGEYTASGKMVLMK